MFKSHLPEYGVWKDMRQRCTNPARRNYYLYGGRGICVCEKWMISFDEFYSDMGPRPTKQHQIDRIDNDGNYEPSNCRWATRSMQQLNKRGSRYFRLYGCSIEEKARQLRLHRHTLKRINEASPLASDKEIIELASKGLTKVTQCFGSSNGQSKLTAEQVVAIRRRHKDGESACSIARSLGVGSTCIDKVVHRISWSHIE